jgi:hypothetical protein
MNRENKWRGKGFIALVRQSDNTLGQQSSEAQEAWLRQSGEELEMYHVDSVVSAGVTGSLPGLRKDLEALLQRKRDRNDFEVILCQRFDRMTRGGGKHGIWFEYELERLGLELLYVGDDVPEGPFSTAFRAFKYDAAKEQARSISQRVAQGAQYALEQGRQATVSRTPFGCDRLYTKTNGEPLHRLRDMRDGRQLRLSVDGSKILEELGVIGARCGSHYRKQKHEGVTLAPGDEAEQQIVRDIFSWHYREGLGGKRIADRLNQSGRRAPEGGEWSQRQVESVYENPAYTGRTRGNESSTAIYHERHRRGPRPVNLDPKIAATAERVPKRHRPPEDWYWQTQPLMLPFLQDEELRQIAYADHDRLFAERWQRRIEGTAVPHKSKSRHKGSDYLLSGILVALQDVQFGKREPLVGHLSGPSAGPKTRYYRHKRGNRDYKAGSVYSRLVPAEPLEAEVLRVVREVLLQLPDLRIILMEQVGSALREQASHPAADVDDMVRKRQEVRDRREMLVRSLDAETLADTQKVLAELTSEAHKLDAAIKQAQARQGAQVVDPQGLVDEMLGHLFEAANQLEHLPRVQLKGLIGLLIEEAVVDLETKDVRLTLKLPYALNLRSPRTDQKAMCLEPNSQLSTVHETQALLDLKAGASSPLGVILAAYKCEYLHKVGSTKPVCYLCTRRPLPGHVKIS